MHINRSKLKYPNTCLSTLCSLHKHVEGDTIKPGSLQADADSLNGNSENELLGLRPHDCRQTRSLPVQWLSTEPGFTTGIYPLKAGVWTMALNECLYSPLLTSGLIRVPPLSLPQMSPTAPLPPNHPPLSPSLSLSLPQTSPTLSLFIIYTLWRPRLNATPCRTALISTSPSRLPLTTPGRGSVDCVLLALITTIARARTTVYSPVCQAVYITGFNSLGSLRGTFQVLPRESKPEV
ncbi:hypothetical protein J6590_026398 [Homalodisca vitripennis]|nr:hypothetical protein J6590_026398 [Homalodisca vitripennis]